MADAVRLDTMRTRVRSHLNLESEDQLVTNSELNGYINDWLRRLYNLLRSSFGQDYFWKSATITTATDTEVYALPSDFLSLLRAEIRWSTTDRQRILPYQQERASSLYGWTAGWSRGLGNFYYRLGKQLSAGPPATYGISFLPIPKGAHTIGLEYIPSFVALSADGDTFDGVIGWEDYAVWGTIADVLAKEESDTSWARLRIQQIEEDIQATAGLRDQSEPAKIASSEFDRSDWVDPLTV